MANTASVLAQKAAASEAGEIKRPLIRIDGVSKTYQNGTVALADVKLDVRSGEFLSLLGPSGCGKSTLLRMIAGLGAPSSGVIDWTQARYDVSGEPQRSLGFVFQEPTLDALGDGVRQCLFAAEDCRRQPPRRRRADRRGRRHGRTREIRPTLSARIVGRHENESFDRACAGGKAARITDGRAIRRVG